MTDRHGDADTGRVVVPIILVGMLLLSYFDVTANHAHFDAQAFGIGVGAVLAGFAAYLIGDSKPTPNKPNGN